MPNLHIPGPLAAIGLTASAAAAALLLTSALPATSATSNTTSNSANLEISDTQVSNTQGSNTQGSNTQGSNTTNKPNIVLILTDDQRAGTEIGMPTVMQQLAAKGTTYTNAVVPTSWCCPSRASLLTGNFSHTTGLWENTSGSPWGAWPAFNAAGLENNTIATALDNAGYHTGLFGKYLNDAKFAGPGYTPPGWDTYEAFLGGQYNRYRLSSDTTPVTGQRRYLTDELADRATRFIRNTPQNQPLFLYFSPFAPHYPFDPGPYKGTSDDSMNDVFTATNFPAPTYMDPNPTGKPRWMKNLPITDEWLKSPDRPTGYSIEQAARMQQDTLMGVDKAIQQLIAELDRTGRTNDTLFIFTSDNGYSWGEHRLQGKNTPYDSSIRVPLIIRYDGKLSPNSTDTRITAANIDVHATALNAAGLPQGRIDGKTLLGPHLRDGVVMEAMRWRGWRNRPAYCGFRTEDTLYVRYVTGEEELYDYTTDPYEQNNLANKPAYADLKQTMKNLTLRNCNPVPPGYTWGDTQPRTVKPVTNPTVETTSSRKKNGTTWRTYRIRWAAPRNVADKKLTFTIKLKTEKPTTAQISGKRNIQVNSDPTTVCTVTRKVKRGLQCTFTLPKPAASTSQVRVDTRLQGAGEARGRWTNLN